jgi:invasion protein IalB
MLKSVKIGLSVLVLLGAFGLVYATNNAGESENSDAKMQKVEAKSTLDTAATDDAKKVGVVKDDAKNGEKTPEASKDSESNEKKATPKSNIEPFDDWALECYDEKINGLACQMIQRVVHGELKQNVLVMSVAYSKDRKKDVVQFVLPLDFNLIPGALIEVGEYKEVLSVNRCSAEGCFIEGGISEKFVEAMKKSKAEEKGRFVIAARDDKKIAIPFSAKGFSIAYDKMQSKNK